MLLQLDQTDPRPLSEQIASGVRRAIAQGELAPGDRLPSGRDLADASGVALETVQRAYRALAAEGTVTARVGRGTSVAPDLDARTLSLEADVGGLVTRARALGLEEDALVDLVRGRWAAGL